MGIVSEFYVENPGFDQEEYDRLQRRMALESSVFSDVSSLFNTILPKIHGLITSLIPNFVSRSEGIEEGFDTRGYSDVLRDVGRLNFVVYEDTLITVPEGFSGKLVPFLNVMVNTSGSLYTELSRILVTYDQELSVFLSHADARMTNKDNSIHYKKIKKLREGYEKSIKGYFNPKYDGITRQKLGNVIDRFKDLDEVVKLTSRLKVLFTKKHLTELQTKVQTVSDLMELIYNRITNGTITNYSPMIAKTLSEGAYEVAKMVELYQLYAYLTEVTVGSVKSTGEILKKLVGKSK